MPAKRKRKSESSLKTLKHRNRLAVLEHFRRREAASVAETAKATGLSVMTVHNIVDYFLAASLLREAGVDGQADEAGRKARLFAFNADYRYIYSIKIVERLFMSALTNLRGEILTSHTASLAPDAGLDDVLALVRDSYNTLTRRVLRGSGHCIGAVAGCPGIVDVDKGVCALTPHFPSWGLDVPMRDLLEDHLPLGLPVHVDNWMRFHAYGELVRRRKGPDTFFLVGTEYDGLAGGLILGGRLCHGARGLPGELGHMVVDPASAEVCACGGVGCLEVAVSPRRMEARAEALRRKRPDSLLFQSGAPATFGAIADAANQDDALARQLIDASVGHFAVAVNNLVHACDPEAIIIQGYYAEAGEYFLSRLIERANTLTLKRMRKNIAIEYSHLGDECSLVGGACYVADGYFENLSLKK